MVAIQLHEAAPRFVEEEVISSRERVSALVAALTAHRATGVAWSADHPYRRMQVRLEPPGRLMLEAGDEPVSFPVIVGVRGYTSLFEFMVERPSAFPDGVRAVRRVRTRVHRRVPAPPRAFAVLELGGERVVRPLVDLSLDGLGLVATGLEDVLGPGTQLPALYVEWKGGRPLPLVGEVRHVSVGADGRTPVAGVRVEPRGPRARRSWERELGELLSPATRVGGIAPDAMWRVYANSGYFHLSDKDETHFRPLRRQFAAATRLLDRAPHLGCRVGRFTERGLEGTVSQLKVHEHAWVVFQLARVERGRPLWSAGSDVLRELHIRGYEHAQRDPDLRYLLSYVQEAARFSRLLQYDVPEHYARGGRACLVPFHAREAAFDSGSLAPASPGVGPPTGAELERLFAVVAATRPAMYAETYDLVPARLRMDALRSRWGEAGLLRERQVLVARADGRARAAAVLDAVHDGLHLFGLLDSVRLFPLEDGGEAQFGVLLQEARRWYAAAGKGRYVYFQEHPDTAHLEGQHFQDMGRATTTILSADLLPELLERLHEVTAPTPAPLGGGGA